jgi:hypothetical protein
MVIGGGGGWRSSFSLHTSASRGMTTGTGRTDADAARLDDACSGERCWCSLASWSSGRHPSPVVPLGDKTVGELWRRRTAPAAGCDAAGGTRASWWRGSRKQQGYTRLGCSFL